MTIEESIQHAKQQAVTDAITKLSVTTDWQKRGKMGRLYMLCLELDSNHIRLTPLLKKMGVKLG